MKSILLLAALSAALLLAGGCASDSATSARRYPAKAANAPIEVLLSAPTDRKFEQLGFISAGNQTLFSERNTSNVFLENLKAQARRMGADAIEIGSAHLRTPSSGSDGARARSCPAAS